MKDEDQGWGRGAGEMIPKAIARILEGGAGLARSSAGCTRLALGAWLSTHLPGKCTFVF